MNYNFSEHDRAVESSPERRQLSAALSRQTKAGRELMAVRVQLEEARASSSAYRPGVASNYQRQQHSDGIADLQKTFGRLRHEEEAAKVEAGLLRGRAQSRRLDGRVDVHRQITAAIVDGLRTLLDAVGEDRQFREQLAADGLQCQSPLRSIVADAAGGAGFVDQIAKQLEAWLAEIERRNPYGLVSPPAKQPQTALA